MCEVREATMFSLIADEASDVNQKQQLCINLRWVDDDLNIKEAPVELICVPKLTPPRFIPSKIAWFDFLYL